MKKKILLFTLFAAAIVFVLAARAWFEADSFTTSARDAIAVGDINGGVQNYRRALGWALPIRPVFQPIFSEASQFVGEKIIEPKARLETWRDLRRGVYGSRGFLDEWSGRAEALSKIDAEIAKLEPNLQAQNHIQELNLPRADYPAQAFTFLCFVGWVLSVLATIWWGFEPSGKIKWRVAIKGLMSWAILFCGWMIGLN